MSAGAGDRELLELAAKAIGMTLRYNYLGGRDANQPWDPLADDGDALRLAVHLHLNVNYIWDGENDQFDPVSVSHGVAHVEEQIGITLEHEFDEYSATRRAIVRAAAEIGNSA